MPTPENTTQPAEPYLLGDHPALDLLNTEAQVDGHAFDFWNSGEDVLKWLERCGFVQQSIDVSPDSPGFLAAARELRAVARELIERRKHGQHANPERLNRFLHNFQSYPSLEWQDADNVRLVRRQAKQTPGQLLGAVAEAIATLLAEGDFRLVRQCEHPECVMWFYDRTKSHRRRWCSMTLCGNRHKVAEFRKRVSMSQNR